MDVVVASSVELSESPAQPVRCRLSGMSALPDGRGKVYMSERLRLTLRTTEKIDLAPVTIDIDY